MHLTDVVLLAGGGSTRMGRDKASMPVAGRRLIDHVLDDLACQPDIGRIVVVAPPTLHVPDWTLHTMEEPPGGGPVAGLFAGLGTLGSRPDDHVLVLTCDAPRAARLAPALIAAADACPDADGVLAVANGRPQYLLAVYRVAALRRGLQAISPDRTAHGAAMRRLVETLDVQLLPVADALAADLDDPDDVSRWLTRFPHAR